MKENDEIEKMSVLELEAYKSKIWKYYLKIKAFMEYKIHWGVKNEKSE